MVVFHQMKELTDYDIIDSEGDKWEVRSLTKDGVYFCPSYMVGSGRDFDEVGFLTKLNNIKGYVIADITKFPNIPFWIIPKSKVMSWWKRSYSALQQKLVGKKH